jgi:hypothetical protein
MTSRLPTVEPGDFLGAALLALGLAAATAASDIAVRAGERPATLFPTWALAEPFGVHGLLALRLLVIVGLWAVVAGYWPRYRAYVAASAGAALLCWAAWQFWLLLART